MRRFFQAIAASALVVLSFGAFSGTLANHDETGGDHAFATDAFEDRWERLDRPVTEFGVDRTLWWGPGPYTPGIDEEYQQSPGGERLVQYFDKSRMEINNPAANPDDLWYVTNGLLVVEMVEGRMQVGHNEFRDAELADVPVAGDPDNPYGPTYATLAQRLDDPPATIDAQSINPVIGNRIDRDGNVTHDPALESYGIDIGIYVPETDHAVAAPFWVIMNETGTIYENGELTNGLIFRNPFYAVGFPITEPYWSTATVAGVEQDVLLQCFERRCLTHTPGNEIGWQVEAGNVGQHYYRWRYGDGGQETETVNVYFVAIGDNGQNGQLVGCEDSLIPVPVDIQATDDVTTRVERTLTALFGADADNYGHPDLYDSLDQSSLAVQSVTMAGGEATVAITGDVTIRGVCDEPRFEEQILQTLLDVNGVTSANIIVNGTPLDQLFGGPGDGTETAQIYYVAIGDDGQNGIPVGLGDSLIPVDVEIEATDDLATRIDRSLDELLNPDSETIVDDQGRELYTALFNSDLQIVSTEVTGALATVHITGEVVVGGVGDEPRFIEQIRQTILQHDEIQVANVFINGDYLAGYFGDWDLSGGVLATFNVGGELFQLWTTNPQTIDDIYAVQAGELDAIPNGPLLRDAGEAHHNQPWSWHLDPLETEMAEANIGTCDATPSQVEANLDQMIEDIGRYCPWNAELVHVEQLGPAELDDGVLATFEVSGEQFVIWSLNPDTIEQILDLEAGTSNASIPNGPLHRGPGVGNHNAPWSWHLDPWMTAMAEVTIEVCDGTPSFVEANVDYFVDDVDQYCPWNAELVSVQDLRVD